MTRLVAVPNVSEGRDTGVLDAIGAAFATHAEVLHRSEDADHHRAVFFLAGEPGRLHLALAPPATLADARAIAAEIRDPGLPGVRALGLRLERQDVVQVSTNIEDHRAVTAAAVLDAVRARAAVAGAELVAPAPEAALAGWPADVELRMPGSIEALLGR